MSDINAGRAGRTYVPLSAGGPRIRQVITFSPDGSIGVGDVSGGDGGVQAPIQPAASDVAPTGGSFSDPGTDPRVFSSPSALMAATTLPALQTFSELNALSFFPSAPIMSTTSDAISLTGAPSLTFSSVGTSPPSTVEQSPPVTAFTTPLTMATSGVLSSEADMYTHPGSNALTHSLALATSALLSSASASADPNGDPHPSSKKGIILLVVVGALVGFTFIACVFAWYIRINRATRRRRLDEFEAAQIPEEWGPDLDPNQGEDHKEFMDSSIDSTTFEEHVGEPRLSHSPSWRGRMARTRPTIRTSMPAGLALHDSVGGPVTPVVINNHYYPHTTRYSAQPSATPSHHYNTWNGQRSSLPPQPASPSETGPPYPSLPGAATTLFQSLPYIQRRSVQFALPSPTASSTSFDLTADEGESHLGPLQVPNMIHDDASALCAPNRMTPDVDESLSDESIAAMGLPREQLDQDGSFDCLKDNRPSFGDADDCLNGLGRPTPAQLESQQLTTPEGGWASSMSSTVRASVMNMLSSFSGGFRAVGSPSDIAKDQADNLTRAPSRRMRRSIRSVDWQTDRREGSLTRESSATSSIHTPAKSSISTFSASRDFSTMPSPVHAYSRPGRKTHAGSALARDASMSSSASGSTTAVSGDEDYEQDINPRPYRKFVASGHLPPRLPSIKCVTTDTPSVSTPLDRQGELVVGGGPTTVSRMSSCRSTISSPLTADEMKARDILLDRHRRSALAQETGLAV